MNYYGFEHFHFEIIEECAPELLSAREQYWISELKSLIPNGYNILPGGISLYGENNPFFGKRHTEEAKKAISIKNTGKRRTVEERAAISKRITGENNPFYGCTHSDETKQKIKETCIKNGVYQKSAERMRLNNPNDGTLNNKMTAMYDLDFNLLNIFQSATEAGEYIKLKKLSKAKIPSNSISDVCRGIQKTAFGYYWEYIDFNKIIKRTIESNQFLIKKGK